MCVGKIVRLGEKLKGKDRFETAENCAILFIAAGAGILSAGMGLTAITPKGLPAILAMAGAFISFVSTVGLIFIWLAKEFSE